MYGRRRFFTSVTIVGIWREEGGSDLISASGHQYRRLMGRCWVSPLAPREVFQLLGPIMRPDSIEEFN